MFFRGKHTPSETFVFCWSHRKGRVTLTAHHKATQPRSFEPLTGEENDTCEQANPLLTSTTQSAGASPRPTKEDYVDIWMALTESQAWQIHNEMMAVDGNDSLSYDIVVWRNKEFFCHSGLLSLIERFKQWKISIRL
ncbi:hypothetical protein TNCV_3833511 [Trichonephila clavipes]|nr:hypothetical protein TNCV_3833511 [Trichonephila clavipes]